MTLCQYRWQKKNVVRESQLAPHFECDKQLNYCEIDLLAIVWVFLRNSTTDGSDVVLKNLNSVKEKDYLVPVGMKQFFTFLLSISEDLIVDPYIAAMALIKWAKFDHCILPSMSSCIISLWMSSR